MLGWQAPQCEPRKAIRPRNLGCCCRRTSRCTTPPGDESIEQEAPVHQQHACSTNTTVHASCCTASREPNRGPSVQASYKNNLDCIRSAPATLSRRDESFLEGPPPRGPSPNDPSCTIIPTTRWIIIQYASANSQSTSATVEAVDTAYTSIAAFIVIEPAGTSIAAFIALDGSTSMVQ